MNNRKKTEIDGVELVGVTRIETPGEGFLHFFESSDVEKEFPYSIKRMYYITETAKGIQRGGHAHKNLKQILFCPYGDISLILNNGSIKLVIDLNKPDKAVIISKPIWREMVWNMDNSVLCVGASEYYDEKDYIRDYKTYVEYVRSI